MYRSAPARPARRLYSDGASRRRARREDPLDAAARPLETAHELVDLLVERQAADVVLLDLTQLNAFAEYFIIATVDNVRQSRAIADALAEKMRSLGGKLDSEGDPESGWLLIDAGHGVFVHLFSLESRAYYNLEGLWSRAQEVVRIQ